VATTDNPVTVIVVADKAAEADFGLQKEAAGTGSIAGVVYNDANENMVQDDGEEGIAGVVIILSGNAIGQVKTDENGDYLFSKLPAGDYQVTKIALEGFTPTTPDTIDVKLSEGQEVTNADFGCVEKATS